jgi:hypothetical protein
MSRDDDDDDRVGYGKPPKHTRFKRGQSGNPRGRARAIEFRDWENPIQKYLLEPITMIINGKKEKVPVVDALMMTAIKRALGGCTKTLKVLLDASGGFKALIKEQERQKTQADQEFLDQLLKEAKEFNRDTGLDDDESDGGRDQ